MSTKHIISTINVILALLVTFSTQLNYNQSDTYQDLNEWSLETNLLEFNDDSNEQLLAFNPCLVHYCPKGMECDINSSNIPVCICQRTCPYFNKRKRRQLCGSNGHLYENFCELYRDGCRRREDITISDMSVCVTSETSTIQVQQQLDCSSDEYALMKDNLLLFHHQNMAYLQHGSINEVHRMDYLVSIIFSHYDQNNDGLVEKDELAFMWNTMDMHHVANDSNCTLLDMLVYDDTNNDQVLTINEFNDAFRRISEVNTESYKQTPTYELPTKQQPTTNKPLETIPSVHLEMAKVLNNMNVHVGDNLELNCDIIGSKKSDVTWKRFGFDLSAVTNKTKSNDDDDEYDDDEEENDLNNEIKFTSNGGIYIQNIEMRHAGNYTCQESSNNEVIQTHIINVHTQPILMITPEVQSKRPGEAVEIICHSVGEYIPTINWHKNEKPLDLISDPNKYTIHGNGTVMRINKLSFSDTGAYTCSGGSFGGHSTVSTLIIQNEPTPLAINKDEKLFVFHSNGISIYSSSLCQLIHEIRAEAYIPGTQETVCNQYSRRCTWGQAVSVAAPSDGLIYVSQPMMNRLIVLSIAQLIIIETIPTDGTPMELHHIPKNDQLWIVNFDIHRDETIKQDPSKSLQMIPDVRMIHVKHHPIHPERISGELMNFYVPPVNRYHDHIHDYKYGFVTHHKQRGFFKLDLSTLRYSKYVDLSIYDCVPEHIKFGGLYGFIIISCMEPVTYRQTGQLVIDSLTNAIISIKADLVGIPYVSPDSRFIITVNHRHDSVLLSVQEVTYNGLQFTFDVETTLNISEIRFVKSSTSLEYDVYATTDKAEILFLSLDTGKVETITNVGEPAMSTWFSGGRKLKESDLFSNLIASPSKDSIFIIDTRTRNVTCQIGNLENSMDFVWA